MSKPHHLDDKRMGPSFSKQYRNGLPIPSCALEDIIESEGLLYAVCAPFWHQLIDPLDPECIQDHEIALQWHKARTSMQLLQTLLTSKGIHIERL